MASAIFRSATMTAIAILSRSGHRRLEWLTVVGKAQILAFVDDRVVLESGATVGEIGGQDDGTQGRARAPFPRRPPRTDDLGPDFWPPCPTANPSPQAFAAILGRRRRHPRRMEWPGCGPSFGSAHSRRGQGAVGGGRRATVAATGYRPTCRRVGSSRCRSCRPAPAIRRAGTTTPSPSPSSFRDAPSSAALHTHPRYESRTSWTSCRLCTPLPGRGRMMWATRKPSSVKVKNSPMPSPAPSASLRSKYSQARTRKSGCMSARRRR